MYPPIFRVPGLNEGFLIDTRRGDSRVCCDLLLEFTFTSGGTYVEFGPVQERGRTIPEDPHREEAMEHVSKSGTFG